MNLLDFFAAAIDSLAWPIAVIVIVILLRKQVTNLLARITKITHKDSEIDLARDVQVALSSADNALGRVSEAGSDPERERIYRLAADSPKGAILDAWLSVEEAMGDYERRHGIEQTDSHRPLYHRIQSIQWSNLDNPTLGQGVLQMLDKLRRIRNDAVHSTDSDITSDTARDYAVLAARVKSKLEEA